MTHQAILDELAEIYRETNRQKNEINKLRDDEIARVRVKCGSLGHLFRFEDLGMRDRCCVCDAPGDRDLIGETIAHKFPEAARHDGARVHAVLTESDLVKKVEDRNSGISRAIVRAARRVRD